MQRGLEPELARIAGQASLPVFEAQDVAEALIALGDLGRALDVLDRASPRGVLFNVGLRDPAFDPVRSDPRFQRLVLESRPSEAAR